VISITPLGRPVVPLEYGSAAMVRRGSIRTDRSDARASRSHSFIESDPSEVAECEDVVNAQRGARAADQRQQLRSVNTSCAPLSRN